MSEVKGHWYQTEIYSSTDTVCCQIVDWIWWPETEFNFRTLTDLLLPTDCQTYFNHGKMYNNIPAVTN